MAVMWNMLANYGNPGQAFADSFQAGMQKNEETAARNAMGALVQDPNNAQALAALAKLNPQAAMQFRQQQAQLAKEQIAQHQDSIIKGAEIIRQFQPKDQASYSAALQAAQQAGIDISQVPQQYNPDYVQGIVNLADALKPQPSDPGMVREFNTAKQQGLIKPDMSFLDYVQLRNPGMSTPITIPYNSTVTGMPSNLPTVSTPQEAMKLPPGTKFRLPDGRIGTVPGGAGGNASGGFPSGSK